ncbi:hypothetical protein ACN28C_29210 [Plantactinospora sp. WMMC1484]|uniref:hypothetical protein n=1 Tax=Plantactinospora sp. WMMC1484 TaxID=3404122 RepID=UPI003BF51D20
MNTPETPPAPAVDWAWTTITTHAHTGHCANCRGTWCPTAEWALWLLITDRLVTDSRRPAITTVARQVMTAHWPHTPHGCRPCALPDCLRIQLAATWLEIHDPHWIPDPLRPRLPTTTPTPDDLRRITGMGGPPTT